MHTHTHTHTSHLINMLMCSELVAWALLRVEYQIGMAFTMEGFRGRGYAKRVVANLCQQLLSMQQQQDRACSDNHMNEGKRAGCTLQAFTPYCYIHQGTLPSLHLFSF